MKIPKIIVITGTHLTPALELINQLQNDPKFDWQIHYIGRQYNSSHNQDPSIESIIIPQKNISFYSINCGKLDRRWLPNTIKGIPYSFKSFFDSLELIKKIQPNLIISFGGYVSVPVIIASFFKKIPSITHEQTLTNSLTTKINSLFVSKIALSFDNSKQKEKLPKEKIVITGNLLRQELFKPTKTQLGDYLKKVTKPIIFITAGNQGSSLINLEIKKILPHLKKYFIIHQTGKNDISIFKKFEKKYQNYLAFDYLQSADMSHALHQSKVIISRSGANTSQEIVALNKSSILIPLKISQQNEQFLNALWVKSKLPNQTEIIKEENLNASTLLTTIEKNISNKTNFHHSESKSNQKIINLIHEII